MPKFSCVGDLGWCRVNYEDAIHDDSCAHDGLAPVAFPGDLVPPGRGQGPGYPEGDAGAAPAAPAPQAQRGRRRGLLHHPALSGKGQVHRGGGRRLGAALLLVLAALLAGFAFPACSGLSGPEETTLAVYEAADDGDLDELESYYSEDLTAAMDSSLGQLTGGTEGFADHLARGGIIEDVRVDSVQENGDFAHVSVIVRYDEAELAERNEGGLFPEDNPVRQGLPLVRERGEAGGAWKVSVDYLGKGE